MGGCNRLLLNQIARPHGRVQSFIIKSANYPLPAQKRGFTFDEQK